MPIRVITLDWGDTLATNHGQPYGFVHRRALQQLQRELEQRGATLPPDWLARREADWQAEWVRTVDPRQNPDHKEFDQLGMIQAWITDALPAIGDAERDELVACFSEPCLETVLAYDGITAVLAELKAMGLRLGILSHVAWHREACAAWMARRGWDMHLDFLSLSSDVGWIKPHPAHYEHAVEQAGCQADEILHVGDHPLRDVVGGREFGFRTCLRHTEGIYERQVIDGCQPDYEIAHLRELPALLHDSI